MNELNLWRNLKNREWKVTDFKLHPKVLYKYVNINEKVKVTSAIRAINDVNDVMVTDALLICEQFNEWFFKVFRVEQCDARVS